MATSKSTTIRVHLTTDERRELRIAAAKVDLTLSVLVRKLAMMALPQWQAQQATKGRGR
jgi:hypothetical protein